MLPKLLVPDNTANTNGVGPGVDLGAEPATLIVLTLAIDRVLEQEALQISVWGSEDNQNWGIRPLTSFPPKSYCGCYSQLLNMTRHQGVHFLRVEWKMSRWSKPAANPLFEFCVTAEESGSRVKRPANVVPIARTTAVA